MRATKGSVNDEDAGEFFVEMERNIMNKMRELDISKQHREDYEKVKCVQEAPQVVASPSFNYGMFNYLSVLIEWGIYCNVHNF